MLITVSTVAAEQFEPVAVQVQVPTLHNVASSGGRRRDGHSLVELSCRSTSQARVTGIGPGRGATSCGIEAVRSYRATFSHRLLHLTF
jgi:hypothetical protein